VNEVRLEAESIASAAVSRTHVFVSTVTALVTLDAGGLGVAAEFVWKNGGLSTPAISDDDSVYAVAGDTLFCFGPRVNPLTRDAEPNVHDRIARGWATHAGTYAQSAGHELAATRSALATLRPRRRRRNAVSALNRSSE
jgi:hypothetical protein